MGEKRALVSFAPTLGPGNSSRQRRNGGEHVLVSFLCDLNPHGFG